MGFDPVSYAMGKKAGGGGGGGATVVPLSVTANGTYQETGKAFSPVTVDVVNEFDFSNAMGTKMSELPDLSKLDRTSQVLYFIVDTAKYDVDLYSKFGVIPVSDGSEITIARGYVGASGFVEVESSTVESNRAYLKTLDGDGERFWVFRLTCAGSLTQIKNVTTGVVDSGALPIVAFYGNIPNVTVIGSYNLFNPPLVTDLLGVKTDNVKYWIGTKTKISGKFGITAANFSSNKYACVCMDMSDLDLSESTTLQNAFGGCYFLRQISFKSQQQTSGVTSINNLVANIPCLEELDLSGLDLSGVSNTGYAFQGLNHLVTITGWANIPVSYSLASSLGLTHDSLMVVINALPEVQTAQTLTLGATNTAKLTAEEIAVATAKGWTVA